MKRTSFFLTGALVLALGGSAQADQITTSVNLNVPGQASVSPVLSVSGAQSVGISYTTTTSTAPGSPVYAVGAVQQGAFGLFPSGGGNFTSNHAIIGVFALQGTQQPPAAGTLQALFTSGVLKVFDLGANTNGTFNVTNPATWGPNTAGATLLATFNLAPASNTLPGPLGANIAQPVLGQNTGIADLTSPFDSQGNFIFSAAGADTILTPPQPFDGLQVVLDEKLKTTPGSGLVAGGVAGLDSIFNSFLGVNTSPFVNSQGGFNPDGTGANGQTVQVAGSDVFPTQTVTQEIPEPASLLLWGAVGGLGVVWRARRKLNL
jgi:hypothetical protein